MNINIDLIRRENMMKLVRKILINNYKNDFKEEEKNVDSYDCHESLNINHER